MFHLVSQFFNINIKFPRFIYNQ